MFPFRPACDVCPSESTSEDDGATTRAHCRFLRECSDEGYVESTATEDEMAAEQAAARTTEVAPYVRKRPARQPFPEHLTRERVVEPAPTACHCCGGHRLRKLGEDITETLDAASYCPQVY